MSRLKRQRVGEDGGDKVTATSHEGIEGEASEMTATSQRKQADTSSRRSLFVRSLPASATSDDLAELFSQSYPLKHATVVIDKITQQSKGFGFVAFADVEDAEHAQKTFNGAEYAGRKIRVEFARPRHRQQDGNSSASTFKQARVTSQRPFQAPSKLIVRNLPWTIKSADQLRKLFVSYGKIKHVDMPKKAPGLSSGFGFIVLRGRKNAERAVAGMDGKEVDGRALAVDWAVEKDVYDQKMREDMEDDEEREIGFNQSEGSVKSEDDNEVDLSEVPTSDKDEGYDSKNEDSSQMDDDKLLEDTGPDMKDRGNANKVMTLFIRNLSFNVSNEALLEHFAAFGPIRYACIVIDHATERSRGSGFVCFYRQEDADTCLREAPKAQPSTHTMGGSGGKERSDLAQKKSLLEDFEVDTSGKYTLDGRVLQVSTAVDRTEAARLAFTNTNLRDLRDRDKRRLYLLSEGTVPSNNPLYDKLSPSEVKMREDSAKQRQTIVRSNPTLHLSLTRLSVRNLPRSITSKALKALAREAVVGFAREAKAGSRRQLSKEELARGGEEMRANEKERKLKGKGIIKQAKIVYEGRAGGKVTEDSGAGRSRGYGFVEYASHRWALMGLRWLNGHAVSAQDDGLSGHERKKRLIVEFAIENAQVVLRRQQREDKARERSKLVMKQRQKGETPAEKTVWTKDQLMAKTRKGSKRKQEGGHVTSRMSSLLKDTVSIKSLKHDEKAAKRQKIIGKKRMSRKMGSKI